MPREQKEGNIHDRLVKYANYKSYKEMEAEWALPQKYWCYKKSYQTLRDTRQLFKRLFIDYRVCIKCILRLYSFEHPRIYYDPEFYLEILPSLLQNSDYLKQYDPGQCCMGKICWLCQQIFQKAYSKKVVDEVNQLVKERGYQMYTQFKLFIRTPNIILLRHIILARYLYCQFCKENLPEEQITNYYNILVLPYQTNKFIDTKTILKWILAGELNNSTSMTSTADDHPQNLVISIDQQYSDEAGQSALMSQFRTYLGLQKKKEKSKGRKQCLDLGNKEGQEEHVQNYKCNGNNINKLVNLKQTDFKNVLEKIKNIEYFWQFINGNQESRPFQGSFVTHKLILYTKNVYLCGRYIKFSRYLSQTPWVINGKNLTEGSLQERIEDKIFKLFYPGKKKEQIETKFHAGGREDIDVRMLQGGRPFVLEFVNPIKAIKSIKQEEVITLIPKEGKESIMKEYNKWLGEQKESDQDSFHTWRIVKMMELLINYDNPYVQVQELQQTTESYISVELKAAEMEKIKHYLCYIYSIQELTTEDKDKLDAIKDLTLEQLTPLRVLHRRTLMIRDKTIHCLKMHLVSRHSAILQVWASAGTYIKQFVHGDLGRTLPNVGSLLGKEVDILQLDVGSLKEGQWAQGDDQLMKLEKLEWMQ